MSDKFVVIRSIFEYDGTYHLQVFLEKTFYIEEKTYLFESLKKTFINFLKQRESLRNTISDFFNTVIRNQYLITTLVKLVIVSTHFINVNLLLIL